MYDSLEPHLLRLIFRMFALSPCDSLPSSMNHTALAIPMHIFTTLHYCLITCQSAPRGNAYRGPKLVELESTARQPSRAATDECAEGARLFANAADQNRRGGQARLNEEMAMPDSA